MTGPILGIESSCDETSAAVLDGDGRVLGLVIHSQDVHEVYGGVVPELAARAHIQRIDPVVAAALEQAGVRATDLSAVAVTAGPGLIGALLVGVAWANGFGYSLDIPVIPVHHMEGHLFGPVLEDPEAVPPFIALLVSGGHTQLLWVPEWGRYILLGQTRDDAAGEAFDKVGQLLGLPYPGGPSIQAEATSGDPHRYDLPRPMLRPSDTPEDSAYFDFSFSGLKTAVAQLVASLGDEAAEAGPRADVAASFQAAAVDVLVAKTERAVREVGCERVLVGGGVSANKALKEGLAAMLGSTGRLFVSTPRLAMDNAAMIARAGLFRMGAGPIEAVPGGASAGLPMPGLLPWSPAEGHFDPQSSTV